LQSPFKAAQSYGPADGDLFFGRESEGIALTRFFLDRPIAILTAPSGIGKTSLLHAKVIPLLEKERWAAACARPHDDPILSLREALADCLLPDPHSEVQVIEQLRHAMPATPAPTLSSGLAWYASRPLEQRTQLRLFQPDATDGLTALPMTCRALRGSIECSDLIEHFEALVVEGNPLGITPQTRLQDLAKLLRATQVSNFWRSWRAGITAAPGLIEALSFLETQWLPVRPSLCGIELILDQFEEIFTRLPASTLGTLLAATEQLLFRRSNGGKRRNARPEHIAFSLRKEFFADLVPRLRGFGPAERLTFFLGAMRLNQARAALSRPASLFGVEFASGTGDQPDCIDRILNFALDHDTTATQEDSSSTYKPDGGPMHDAVFYSPALISLIGSHLWIRLQSERPSPTCISWNDFSRLVPRLENVFESFLSEALQHVGKVISEATPFDVLELLDQLVTTTGFRNIVPEDELMNELPLSKRTVEKLLDVMDRELRLIRREGRRGGRFVEIMHERLIPPVRRMLTDLRRRDIGRAALLPAYDLLHILPDEPDPTSDTLPAHFRETLVHHLNQLELDRLASKALLRSVLVAGPSYGYTEVDFGDWNRWSKAIYSLSRAYGSPMSEVPAREALLTSAGIIAELSRLRRSKGSPDAHKARHIAVSALADRSDSSGERIWRVFRLLAKMEAGR
jgi:hypothetical protein